MNPKTTRTLSLSILGLALALGNVNVAHAEAGQDLDLDTFYLCRMVGNATTDSGRQLNRLKNRYHLPEASDFDYALTLERLVKPGDDRSRWFNHQAVDLVGYVVRIRRAKPTSCNCDRPWKELRSTIIELTLSAEEGDTRPMRRLLAVVTPRLRRVMEEEGLDWSAQSLADQYLGHFVRVKGWLLFNTDHLDQARNTRVSHGSVDRATAWEIHPLTSIQVYETPAEFNKLELDLDSEYDELTVEIHPFNFTAR